MLSGLLGPIRGRPDSGRARQAPTWTLQPHRARPGDLFSDPTRSWGTGSKYTSGDCGAQIASPAAERGGADGGPGLPRPPASLAAPRPPPLVALYLHKGLCHGVCLVSLKRPWPWASCGRASHGVLSERQSLICPRPGPWPAGGPGSGRMKVLENGRNVGVRRGCLRLRVSERISWEKVGPGQEQQSKAFNTQGAGWSGSRPGRSGPRPATCGQRRSWGGGGAGPGGLSPVPAQGKALSAAGDFSPEQLSRMRCYF